MQISFEEEQQVFHLYNDKISYVIQVEKQRYLKHCYYGKRIKRWHSGIKDYYYDRGFCANPVEEDRTFSLDTQLREFPESGQGDFRSPAYELEDRNGDRNARFFYNNYRILSGKIAPDGLPHVYTDADTEAMLQRSFIRPYANQLPDHRYLQTRQLSGGTGKNPFHIP